MNNYFSDEYTVEIEDLGYLEQANKIRDMIINCETPFVIGISGRWGSGKTSLMKYLMASLGGKVQKDWLPFQPKPLKDKEEEDNFGEVIKGYEDHKNIEHIHSIWFNPWEHENHDEPIIELLKEIRKYFTIVSKGWEEAKKLGAVVFRSGLKKLTTIIQKEGEKSEYESFEYSTRNQRFKLIFQSAIEELLTIISITSGGTYELKMDPSAKLVIFIDDLDRCEETTISKLLSEIKQHLSTKRCVFVFGYDRHHVEKALSKTLQRSDKETRSYLEKLFQSTIYIKQPAEEKYKEFVMKRLKKFDFGQKRECKDLSDFICDIIDPNPRRIKAFLTAFRFHSQNFSFVNPEKVLDDLQKLALITYLKIFHEPVYAVIENNNELVVDLAAVLKHNDRDAIANHNEYFFYLEMRSHLQNYTEKVFTEKIIEREFLKNDESAEKKFLTEVYEMQGRHKSYENFRKEFQHSFDPIIESNHCDDIKKYL
ncbi:MAG: hypothetical protein HQK96_11890 [Nitrospirae bacterium]|nr:hypothetical protein [Nitrospirota bacterium]